LRLQGLDFRVQGLEFRDLLDKVAEVLGALELALVEPLLQQRLLALLEDGARELDGLDGVQRRILQDLRKVDQQRVLRPGVRLRVLGGIRVGLKRSARGAYPHFGFQFSDFGIRVSGFGIRDSGFGIRVSVVCAWATWLNLLMVPAFRIVDSGFGIRISGFGFRVCVPGRPA